MPGIVDFRTVLEDPAGNNITPENPLPVSIDGVSISTDTPIPVSIDGFTLDIDDPLPVAPTNIVGKFRESFENFTPGVNWDLVTAPGDIVQLDGNAVSASYLVISKDPLSAGTESSLTYTGSFAVPLETATGLSMSQRVLGQELALELISTETPLTPTADIAISSVSQSANTIAFITAQPHGLVPGKRIGTYGISDSRLNYPALVVATITGPSSFTCTAGPGGTIPTVTAGPFLNQGYVYFRPALGYAQNGLSQIFENSTATNASLYTRTAAGDSLPSGTASTNHSVTVSTTTGTQAIGSPFTYAFLPASEYRYILQSDRGQWLDAPIDTVNAPTARLLRTQVVPDPSKLYTLRFRVSNDKGLTVPIAKIISASKSGSTTATITTDVPHGLTTSDYVYVQGIRDTANFAYSATQLQVLSVPTTTTFTISFGTSYTGTSYGGFVARVQGANIPSGFPTNALQTVSVISGEIFLTANSNFGWLIGDYVNLYGCRDNATGADLGLDGTYRVTDLSTTNIRLAPIGTTPTPANLGSTNCGGAVIKRTDVRLAFVRIYDYLRERVEVQPNSASAASVPVAVSNSLTIASGFITPINTNTYTLQTSTNLASSATYTGSALNLASSTTSTTIYNAQIVIGVSHTAGLVPGQLYLDVGTETSSTAPTTWYTQFAVPIPSNANWQYFTVPISTRYYRLRFVNGATAQTSFRLSTVTYYNGGGLSGSTGYPANLQYPLSTTALAANGVFTGVTMDFGDTMNIYQTITAVAYADQASASNGFQIQISRDGTNWRVAQQTSLVANTLTSITTHLSYRYARIVYTNGATLQGSFSLDAHVDSQ